MQIAAAQLKRYTELPYVLQILQSHKLTLVNPSSWDDKNDSHFMQVYRDRTEFGSILALCLTEAPQTYHHWRVFTQGASGACLYFDKAKFQCWLDDVELIHGRSVQYRTLAELQETPPKLHDLPYLKRKAYEHEAEFRLVYRTKSRGAATRSFAFPIEIVDGLVLNPWLPTSTVECIKEVVWAIPGCESLEVRRATIVRNDEWQCIADAAEA